MNPSNRRLLEVVVAIYDECDRPVTPADVVASLGEAPEDVAARLATLVECELVATVEGGYRPTVTGRELLDLAADGDVIVVDPDREC